MSCIHCVSHTALAVLYSGLLSRLITVFFFQAWALNKVIANKSSLKSMIQQLNDLVHRDHFSQSLTTLGLLDPVVPKAPDAATNSALPQVSVPTTKYAQVSLILGLYGHWAIYFSLL